MTVTVPVGSLMESAMTAQECLDSLSEHDVLIQAASALLEAASGAGDVAVRPVGRGASLIVGAASVMSEGSLRQAPRSAAGHGGSKVLVVEAVAVGHGVIERAVAEARSEGADWVGAWVWRGSPRLSLASVAVDSVAVDGLLS